MNKEDKERVERIYNFLMKNRKGDTDEIYQQEQDANWLKTFVDKDEWKPSESQMTALFEAIPTQHHKSPNPLFSLYHDLENLYYE